ncbi:hypothetical protein J5Y09_12490 [Roseomonas sp. PWR1]|uniref:Uncharacterized protein n=1 Tax=Roseomonas nitratireducens TaxID=2820810 RepID=A0ABS4ATP5_9PROT|nr:hypothetical protein [Neoroseomonas nitratireducens]MBP0464730.1 hypothetical protein [Neoroseomonas nitratireducens]
MSGGRVFFLAFYAVLALLGLFLAAAAQDAGITIFAWGLILFGVLNAYRTIGAHYSEAGRAH